MVLTKMLLGRWRTALLLIVLASTIALNAISWMQARSMTHFVANGQRTAKPEKLAIADKLKVALMGVELPRPANRRTPNDESLGYETHQIPMGDREWLEAWFVPQRSSRGMVLLFPPYANSKDTLLPTAKILHDLGYEVLLIDFRGAGGSSGSDTTLGIREADDVVQSVAYAQRMWSKRPLILYGASMGATAVMRAIAQKGITPDAVILESPFDRLLNTVRHRFAVMGIPPFPGAALIVFWGGVQQHIDGFAHNPVEYASAIRCPVLLLHGVMDTRVTQQDAIAIYSNLSGRKQFVLFPNSVGHGSLAIDDPILWKRQVSAFLKARQ
ncbi:MAG: alpha/beta hydrolase [Leptolyngbya sp. BL-A-14]